MSRFVSLAGCVGIALLAPLATAASQSAAPLELARLTRPIRLDGTPTAEEWRDVPVLPLTLYMPVFRGTPKQRTEIRVAYDDEFLYAAGWFHDDEPGGVRVNSLYRDRWNGDDAFAIYVDAFNDNQNAKWFGTTPGGIRFDILLSDDGNTSNASWDTFWTTATTVTDSGWFAEVRIPFSSLGFRADQEGKVVMGLTVTRQVSRTGERVTFPEIDPKFEFRRPSVARDVVLRDVRTRTPLYVTPYVLGGTTRNMVQPAAGTGRFEALGRTSREAGADLRYPLSSNLTLDLTYNTDFAQVEADEQQVNLDRFPLFFPERRRFFQENSGVFDFAFGGGSRLFHSRRIGLTPDFTPVPVLGGARLVGRAGAWDVGFLEMQTERQGAVPTENFAVLRLRRPVLNENSTAGLMATSYAGGGRRNVALGTDASLRVRPDEYLVLKWAGTDDTKDSTGFSPLDRGVLDARYERRVGAGSSTAHRRRAWAATSARSSASASGATSRRPTSSATTSSSPTSIPRCGASIPARSRSPPGATLTVCWSRGRMPCGCSGTRRRGAAGGSSPSSSTRTCSPRFRSAGARRSPPARTTSPTCRSCT